MSLTSTHTYSEIGRQRAGFRAGVWILGVRFFSTESHGVWAHTKKRAESTKTTHANRPDPSPKSSPSGGPSHCACAFRLVSGRLHTWDKLVASCTQVTTLLKQGNQIGDPNALIKEWNDDCAITSEKLTGCKARIRGVVSHPHFESRARKYSKFGLGFENESLPWEPMCVRVATAA